MTNELQYKQTDLLEIGKLHKLHSNFCVHQFNNFAHASFGVSCRKTDQSLQGSSSDRWRLRTKHSTDSSNSLPDSIRTFPTIYQYLTSKPTPKLVEFVNADVFTRAMSEPSCSWLRSREYSSAMWLAASWVRTGERALAMWMYFLMNALLTTRSLKRPQKHLAEYNFIMLQKFK